MEFLTPCNRSNEYYKNHYICLWEVTEEEVIGKWKWDDLLKTDRWYERVILPAFKEHNGKYDVSDRVFKMSALRDALFEMQEPSIPSSRACCSSSETEEYGAQFGDESDSYDEVEGNNAMDDALKLFEEV